MNSGAYQLFISIDTKISLQVGKLGYFTFAKGEYIYTGSAMKNLNQRVLRHQKKDKKLNWHIDYLLNNPNVRIIDIKIFESEIKQECEINQSSIKNYKAKIPIRKFGSSDCSNCESHLIKIK